MDILRDRPQEVTAGELVVGVSHPRGSFGTGHWLLADGLLASSPSLPCPM